jgi:hypothetical protein
MRAPQLVGSAAFWTFTSKVFHDSSSLLDELLEGC